MKARSEEIEPLNFFQSLIALTKELIFIAVDNEVDEVTERLAHVVFAAGCEVIEQASSRNFCSESLNFFPNIGEIFFVCHRNFFASIQIFSRDSVESIPPGQIGQAPAPLLSIVYHINMNSV